MSDCSLGAVWKSFWQNAFRSFIDNNKDGILPTHRWLARRLDSQVPVSKDDINNKIAMGIAMIPAMVTVGSAIKNAPKATKRFVDASKLSEPDLRSVNTYEKRIAEHQAKILEFKANPTVKPGMENQSSEVIAAQQADRVRHWETEISTFRTNIEKIFSKY